MKHKPTKTSPEEVLSPEDWDNSDNKRIVGKPDRIYVSRTEHYEVRYFVEHYIEDVLLQQPSEQSRAKVREAIKAYRGRSPIKRDVLIGHLKATLR